MYIKVSLIHDIQVLIYRGSTNERLSGEGVAYDSYYSETDRVNDEYFCSLDRVKCPSQCECLTFAIRCYWVESHTLKTNVSVPYYIVQMEKVTKIFIQNVLQYILNPISLAINWSGLDQICHILTNIYNIIMINAGYNEIHTSKHQM